MTDQYRIVFVPEAREQFDHEYRYSALQWGEQHAESHFAKLDAEIAILKQSPRVNPKVPGQHTDCRKITLPGHLVVYRINENQKTFEIHALLGSDRYHELERIAKERTRAARGRDKAHARDQTPEGQAASKARQKAAEDRQEKHKEPVRKRGDHARSGRKERTATDSREVRKAAEKNKDANKERARGRGDRDGRRGRGGRGGDDDGLGL